MLREIATLDDLLKAHVTELGSDFTPYRNHCYRVANLCVLLSPDGAVQIEKIAVAAAFHDLGIWTDRTFDYLLPSVRLARAYLASSGRAQWDAEVSEMILMHHKISGYDGKPDWLVEPFRRADWIDVTHGAIAFGLSRESIRKLYETWPGAGFHKRLVQLELAHLRMHPLKPFPVFRL